MAIKQPAVWSDFATAVSQIAAILIIVCALAGPAQAYAKGEKVFKFFQFVVEFVTSAAAGFIVFLLLRVTDMPEEWIAAFSGISAFFGTRLMNVLYAIFVGKLKIMLHADEKRKEDKND